MGSIWRERFRIHVYDTEPGGSASIPALCRYMQESANNHAQTIGLSMSEVRETHRMWVLSRLALEISVIPKLGDEITIETWPTSRLSGIRAYRDFRLRNAAGEILAQAASLWLLLDLTSRRPLRIPESILAARHAECVGELAVDASPLLPPERATQEERQKVRWGDLDENGHANNIRYIEWALDSVPVLVRREATPTAMEIQFVDEVLLGEEMISGCEQVGSDAAPCFRHCLRTVEQRLLGIARSDWVRR